MHGTLLSCASDANSRTIRRHRAASSLSSWSLRSRRLRRALLFLPGRSSRAAQIDEFAQHVEPEGGTEGEGGYSHEKPQQLFKRKPEGRYIGMFIIVGNSFPGKSTVVFFVQRPTERKARGI